MKILKKTFWFPKKKYGFGWGLPNTWQGWIILLIYFFLLIVGIPLLNSFAGVVIYLVYFAILTVIFIFIVWKKGEKIDL
ncbi:MAG: hypothetical protein CSB21_02640 [Deltaproteobacteria bacterium]|nr:MAG: hypothetical protein CSB21_02640 [Deltaproteobacteria bacterium]